MNEIAITGKELDDDGEIALLYRKPLLGCSALVNHQATT